MSETNGTRRFPRWPCAAVALIPAWLAGSETAEPLPGRDWPWTAVGRVLTDGDGPCSGVLVAPRTVLTAGHCVVESGWRARPAERLSFALETGEYAVTAVRLAPRPPLAADGAIEDLSQDWALLELQEQPGPRPVPYGGPSAARRAFVLDEPLVKAGWAPRDGEYRQIRDHICKLQDLDPEATVIVYRCPGGAGAGRSGSALILHSSQDSEVVAVQSAVMIRAPLEFGVAVAPKVEGSGAPAR